MNCKELEWKKQELRAEVEVREHRSGSERENEREGAKRIAGSRHGDVEEAGSSKTTTHVIRMNCSRLSSWMQGPRKRTDSRRQEDSPE